MMPSSLSSQDLQALQQKPFRYYFRRHWRIFSLGVVCLFFTNLLDCLYPLAVKRILDNLENGQMGSQLLPDVGLFLGLMAGVALFRISWRIQFGLFQHRVAEELRNQIFQKFTTLGASFYQKNPVGQLMSLITNDINSFRMAVGGGVLVLFDAAFLVVIIVPLMLYVSVEWTWKTLILLPLLPPLIQRIEKLIHIRFKEQQDRFAELSGSAQEIVSGIRVIKSYAQEPAQTDHFNTFSHRYENACNRSARIESLFQPCMEFAVASGVVILLWVGSPQVMTAGITIGSFYAFHRYIHKMTWPMTAIGMGVTMVQQGRASLQRVVELLSTETDIPDWGTLTLKSFESLEVKHLTFTYPGQTKPALNNISFRLQKGETLGVVGSVGSGKSTLMQLICRLYPVPRGMIWVNGHDVNDIRQDSLWSTFAMVPQDAFLFSETVEENIAFGLDSQNQDQEAIRHIARVVNIDEEIEQLTQGYGAFLGERGVNLSGGQKQRLTIARALIRKSPVVVLDDSLSAVDAQTERQILTQITEALNERAQGPQTTILVSHRLAPLQNAQRILVLKDGELEALGPATELIQTSETFRRLSELQQEQHPETLVSQAKHEGCLP